MLLKTAFLTLLRLLEALLQLDVGVSLSKTSPVELGFSDFT